MLRARVDKPAKSSRMASATPDLQLPSQPQGITAQWPIPNYTARWQRPWASAHRGKWGQLTPLENGWKIKKRKHAKKSSFLNILRAIKAGRCRERRYANHIFIQIYFRMHHFQNLLRLRRQGGIGPLTKILRTFLPTAASASSENCWNRIALVKLLTFVDFCVFLGILAFGWLL